MEKNRSKGITIIGWGLYLVILPSVLCTLIITAPVSYVKLALLLAISVLFFLLARGILQLKAFSRRLALILVVPYLVFVMPFLLNNKIKIEAKNFYSTMGPQDKPVSIDVMLPLATIGIACCFVAMIFGMVLFVFLHCPKVKEPFR